MGSITVAIKDMLHKKSYESSFMKRLYRVSRNIFTNMSRVVSDEAYAKWFYKSYTGMKLELDNPQRFNEKIWWLKLNNRDPKMTICSDKYLARTYVAECGFSDILIPQLDVFQKAEEIDFTKYSEEVIVKCNHGSGSNMVFLPDHPENAEDIRKLMKVSLRQDASLISREWNYKNIPRRIVVEKIIRDSNGQMPGDYRFFCFDGVPKVLMRDVGVLNDKGVYQPNYPRCMLDMDFMPIDMKFGREKYTGTLEKPKNFERMKEIAAKLSQPFPMVRVDLYNLDGKIYFGEMTFYHGGGCQQIEPLEWDYRMGSWIDLNSPKIVR